MLSSFVSSGCLRVGFRRGKGVIHDESPARADFSNWSQPSATVQRGTTSEGRLERTSDLVAVRGAV